MIWTAPVTASSGLEPGQHAQPQSHSTRINSDRSGESDPDASMMPPLGFTAAMQARSLNIASAYFKSLDFPALIALAGTHCPGTLGMVGGVSEWLVGWVGGWVDWWVWSLFRSHCQYIPSYRHMLCIDVH